MNYATANPRTIQPDEFDKFASLQNMLMSEYGFDLSQYQRELEELKIAGANAHFLDQQFPPTRESLCQNWEEITDPETKRSWEDITWMRPKQFMGGEDGITLFDSIEPNDIKQGLLGDCYFLCSLSSLAERPYLIKRLFETKTYQSNGLYSIWLNIDGEWRNFVVDDFIPCKHGKPAFSRAQGNELWVLLLEKAYAKAYGSYYKIEGGNPAVALRDLTGAPYQNFDSKDADLMFQFLITHDKGGKGDILTCYTESTKVREEQTSVGLYAGHAYSILDVKEATRKNGQKVRLVQIRNPWG